MIYHLVALSFELQKSFLSAQNLVSGVFIIYTRNIEQYCFKNRRNIPNLIKVHRIVARALQTIFSCLISLVELVMQHWIVLLINY